MGAAHPPQRLRRAIAADDIRHPLYGRAAPETRSPSAPVPPHIAGFSGDIKGLHGLDEAEFAAVALVFTAFFLYLRFASQTASSSGRVWADA